MEDAERSTRQAFHEHQKPTMKNRTVLAALLLAGCGQANMDSAPIEPSPLEEPNQTYFGTPEGEKEVIGLTAIQSEADMRRIRTGGSVEGRLPTVQLDLSQRIESTSSASEALRTTQEYIASPPPEARGIPAYIIEQAAAQAVARRPALLNSARTRSEDRQAISEFVRMLVENRNPNPTPVLEMMRVIQDDLEPGEAVRLSEQVSDNHLRYERALDAKFREIGASCKSCTEQSIRAAYRGLTPAESSGEWEESVAAVADLTATVAE